MSPSQAFLWPCLVILTTTESSAFLLNDHTNSSMGHPDNDNYNIYSKIDALERTLQNLETSMREKTTHSDTLMRQVLLTVTKMEVKMQTSDFQLQNMSLQIEKLENSSDTVIGFTTTLSGNIYSSSSEIIQGSPILYNEGNAYNGTVFTCPSPGLYLFQVTILSSTNGKGVWIYKNSQQITFAYTGNGSPYESGSASAALRLNINDQVYLRPNSASIQIDANSVFTGVKIT